MKTKASKKLIIVITIVLSIILLLPIPLFYKDGGTVEYRAILYSVEKHIVLVMKVPDMT